MSKNWANGSTRRWRTVRAAVLLRDGGRCLLALPGDWPVWGGRARCLGVATQVHHVKGRSVTGDDPQWLVAACRPCNLKVGLPRVDPPPRPMTDW